MNACYFAYMYARSPKIEILVQIELEKKGTFKKIFLKFAKLINNPF